MPKFGYEDSVFLNCPFDDQYDPLFKAIVFTIFDCGFVIRCTLEDTDSGPTRIEKIYRMIQNSKYGIHDISRTELDRGNGLPRFNMPFELGLFLGARHFDKTHRRKRLCLILDREQYRYQEFLSDIGGQDIGSHDDDPRLIVLAVRDWLRDQSKR